MKVLFAFDSSASIGTGHRSRCGTLADALSKKNVSVYFLENPLSFREIKASEFDWVVLDSYRMSQEWEAGCRNSGLKVLTIDDSPKRRYECDVLLDPNLSQAGPSRWDAFVAPWTRVLSGANYLLLRDEFFHSGPSNIGQPIEREFPHVLVSLGGGDEPGVAVRVMRALSSAALRDRVQVTLVAGALNPHQAELEALCNSHPQATFVKSTTAMASIMRTCSFAIGAGGGSQWERAYMGLPSLVVTLAENQHDAVDYLSSQGALQSLGWHAHITEEKVVEATLEALKHPEVLRQIAAKAKALVGEPRFFRDPLTALLGAA